MPEELPYVCAIVNTLPIGRPRKVLAQEHQNMDPYPQEPRDHLFVIGLLTGAAAGAGLALWLAPRLAAELRQRMTDSARSLGQRASNEYQQASTRVGQAVDDLTRKGQDVQDEIAGAVARGAHEVERYATALKSGRATETMRHSAADRSASKPRSL
jgi:gas vesicle protein